MLAIDDGVADQVHAEAAGICLAEVLQQHLPHLRVFGGAGLGCVLVAYEIERHLSVSLCRYVYWFFFECCPVLAEPPRPRLDGLTRLDAGDDVGEERLRPLAVE